MQKAKKLIRCIVTVIFLALMAAYAPIAQLPAAAQSLTLCTAADTPLSLSVSATLADREKQFADAYLKAICDASILEPTEVSDKLWAIAPNNLKLIWQNPDRKRFRAVTWTSWPGYDGKEGSPVELTKDIWITAVPQLQEFCSDLNLDPIALTLRLEQYLGLSPDAGKTKFVEMWVSPSDVFRPCPDKEIDDNRCELEFPLNADELHKAWINAQKASSYQDKGFPWTGLGYTYDWGNPQTEIGASEFLVRKGATVMIESLTETGEYCKRNALQILTAVR